MYERSFPITTLGRQLGKNRTPTRKDSDDREVLGNLPAERHQSQAAYYHQSQAIAASASLLLGPQTCEPRCESFQLLGLVVQIIRQLLVVTLTRFAPCVKILAMLPSGGWQIKRKSMREPAVEHGQRPPPPQGTLQVGDSRSLEAFGMK
jgi:hypothetical protein